MKIHVQDLAALIKIIKDNIYRKLFPKPSKYKYILFNFTLVIMSCNMSSLEEKQTFEEKVCSITHYMLVSH